MVKNKTCILAITCCLIAHALGAMENGHQAPQAISGGKTPAPYPIAESESLPSFPNASTGSAAFQKSPSAVPAWGGTTPDMRTIHPSTAHSAPHNTSQRKAFQKAAATLKKHTSGDSDDDGDKDFRPQAVGSNSEDESDTEQLNLKSKHKGKSAKRKPASSIEKSKELTKKKKTTKSSTSSGSGAAQDSEDAAARRAKTQASPFGCAKCFIPYYSQHASTRHNNQTHAKENKDVALKRANNGNASASQSSAPSSSATITVNIVNNFIGEKTFANANTVAQISAALANTIQGLNAQAALPKQKIFTCNACHNKFNTEALFFNHLEQEQTCREHPLNNGGKTITTSASASSQPALAQLPQLTSSPGDATTVETTGVDNSDLFPLPPFPNAPSNPPANNPIAFVYGDDLSSGLLNDLNFYENPDKALPYNSSEAIIAASTPHSPYPKPHEMPQHTAAAKTNNDNK